MIKIAIAGGNIAGGALLSLLRTEPRLKVVSLYEENPDAPGCLLAVKWGIPVCKEIVSLSKQRPDIIINVTGDYQMTREIQNLFGDRIETIDSKGAKMIWDIIERQKKARVETLKTLQDHSILSNILEIFSQKNETSFLEKTLKGALQIVDAPAGSIVTYQGGKITLMTSTGLSKRFLENIGSSIQAGGLTERVLKNKKMVEIQDTLTSDYNNPAFLIENIRSVLAVPLLMGDTATGILFIDDFKPRRYSTRQKSSIALLSRIIAESIGRYNLSSKVSQSTVILETLLHNTNDLVLITDEEGIVTKCNDTVSTMGAGRDDIIGKPLSHLLNSEDKSILQRELDRKKSVRHLPVTISFPSGSDPIKTCEFMVNATVLTDKMGKTTGGIFVLTDVTATAELKSEMKKKALELNELQEILEEKVVERTEVLGRINRELERANQLRGRFIANMSHELRTPLNSIIGFSDVLIEGTFGDLKEEQKRYISNIRLAGKHLLQLINNVLDLAKIEAGKYELQYEAFYIDELFHEVVNTMKPLAEKKDIGMTVTIDPDVEQLIADRLKVKQILYNLLSNAIKFTPEGGTVEILAEKMRSEDIESVRFVVKDNGIGIPPDDIERIFEEFEQIDSSLSRQQGGVGLGLALTKKLVELHGGNIRAESILGKGSTFSFTIPSGTVTEEAEVTEVEAVRLNFPWMKEEAPLILVVEDDPPTAEILTLHLSQAGYKVVHAYDGEEAVAKARQLRPFAITLDIMLPRKDGWEVLQELKADSLTSQIPVIIHSIVNNKDLAFALGATDYLIKPLNKDDLLGKLQELSPSKGKVSLPQTVLLVEPETRESEDLKALLQNEGIVTYSAEDLKKGVELAVALRPNLIMLNIESPTIDGFELIQELKINQSTKDIPIFIMTDKDMSVEDRMSLLGKIERIIKKHGFDAKELINHIKELEIIYPKRAGLIDDLTGLFSHRYFQIRLAQEVERAGRYKLPLILVIIDIDHFGHFVKNQDEYNGNLVLKKVSELIRKNIRGSDIVVRYGGDSFAVLLPNTVLGAGLSLSNRFNAIIKNYPFHGEEAQPKGRITASAGLAFLEGQSPEEFILCAEKALTHAINKGGDRVEVYSTEMERACQP